MFGRKDEPFKIGRLAVSCLDDTAAVSIYAYTESEIGAAMVGLGNHLDLFLEHLTPEQADILADHLKLAARVARGEIPRPNALNDFLTGR